MVQVTKFYRNMKQVIRMCFFFIKKKKGKVILYTFRLIFVVFVVVKCLLTHHRYRKPYLWDKDQTQCGRGTEDNEDRYDHKGGILLISQYKGQSGANNAHDDHVVHAHSNIFRIVQCWNAYMTCLPCQKDADRLQFCGQQENGKKERKKEKSQ